MSKSNRLNLNIIDRQEDEPDLTEQQFDDLAEFLERVAGNGIAGGDKDIRPCLDK